MKHVATLGVLALAALLGPPAPAAPEPYDVVIADGRIVDGTGNPWFYGDVAIRGDRVVAVGRVDRAGARRVVEAKGLVVAPGFVDMLGQSETALLIDPRAQSKVYQGVTTEITGEGGSIAPQNDYTIAEQRPFLDHFHLTVDWRTLGEYFARFERDRPAVNLATYVGAAQVRQYVLRDEDRAPTPEELDRMRALVEQAMRDGAVGLSTALIYAPGNYAKTEELVELAKVAARYGGVYATHMRNVGDSEMAAIDEAIRIGREANIPVEIFHLKVAGKQNWGKMSAVLAKIEAARAEGIDVTADQYPYVAGATSLGASLPPWVHEGGNAKFVERLRDPAVRERLKREVRAHEPGWDDFYVHVGGGEGILVASVLDRSLAKYEGKRISEVARMMGKADELDALIDLVVADNGQAGAIYFLMSEDDVRLALQRPWVGVGSDHQAVALDGPLAEGRAHPRGFGTFPRILGHYVRAEGVLTLEQAVRKMTSLAANRVHLADRGLLKAGFFADVVVFDPAAIRDVATFEDPNRLSTGVRYVLVNGELVLDDGRQTGARPGRALRGPGWNRG
jgi:dihydroorotase/N-acyl-D-amino-acid deacylase